MEAAPSPRAAVRARRRLRVARRRAVLVTAALVLLAILFGAAYSGSRSTLADGTSVAGVDVGGLTAGEASAALAARADALARRPVRFTAGGDAWELTAAQLGVRADWEGAIRAAERGGDGVGPLRGFRRIHLRLFGAEVDPPVSVYRAALDYKVGQIAAAVDRAHVEPRVVRRGLDVRVVPGTAGARLDRDAAARAIVRALSTLERPGTVALPVTFEQPALSTAALEPAARQARTALSAPVRLVDGRTRWRLPRWRLATLIELPSGGSRELAVAGPQAERFLDQLAANVARPPVDAGFEPVAGGVRVVPHVDGRRLDIAATAAAIRSAALSPTTRTAKLVVQTAPAERTTAEARAMGITGVVASYTTTYGGTPGRLHNVRLVAELIDGTLVAPGATFSFNATTGERNAERGFAEAPVIINGELQNGIGGGVCQVSTTVFNAAFEAGLPIGERTNHALYIGHYPLGRDATVNYPDLDLTFTNDTGRWLLLRTFVGAGSLTVNLYGTPPGRRVESSVEPLAVTGPVPVEETEDAALTVGRRVVDEVGEPPRATSVTRRVYDRDGALLSESTWHSSYVGEPTLVRVGTKPKPEPKPKPKREPKATPDAAVGAEAPAPVEGPDLTPAFPEPAAS